MISLENLRPNLEPDPNELPLASDHEVRMALRHKIDKMIHRVGDRFRIGSSKSEILFSIDGEVESSYVDSRKGQLRVERERVQELGITVMKDYGLDPESPKAVRKEKTEQTTTEHTLFLSSTRDMAFVRHHQFITETAEPVALMWTAKDIGPENWWERVTRK